jgi:fumarylpyruvate hydrolase
MQPCLSAPPAVAIPVDGTADLFHVRRIYCVGRNYAAHAREMGGDPSREAPFFFCKPADSIVTAMADGIATLHYPSQTNDLHHEVELVVALGSGGRNIAVGDALSHVFGYSVGLDMTRRDLQAEMKAKGRPWEVGKAFDESAPVGALAKSEALDLKRAGITLTVNDQPRQASSLDQMIWSVEEIIANLSTLFELKAGDLIFTGTPEGVAAMQLGDIGKAHIDGLPPLTVRVAEPY